VHGRANSPAGSYDKEGCVAKTIVKASVAKRDKHSAQTDYSRGKNYLHEKISHRGKQTVKHTITSKII
jgi:hypothetical protein